MVAYISRIPSDLGPDLDYRDLRRWLQALEAEVEMLKARLDGRASGAAGRSGQNRFIVDADEIRMGAAFRASFEAPTVEFNTPVATFSGILRCDSVIANSVIGSSYTPGAGNVM